MARLYRAGELTAVRIPTERDERVRDLVRCREIFQREILKSRHYLLKFLARRGLVYRDGNHWTQRHMMWLHVLGRGGELAAEDAIVFREFLALLEYKLSRRTDLDAQIEALALTPAFATPVGRLRCFRGIQTHAAMVLATELVDWRRFETPRQLMAYLGLVPSESSTGERVRRGGITKAGNGRARRVLIEGAWTYRFRARMSRLLEERQAGLPKTVREIAWKAQVRLCGRYRKLMARGKRQRVVVTAIAREMAAFLWAIGREVQPQRAC